MRPRKRKDVASQMVELKAIAIAMDAKTKVPCMDVGASSKPKWDRENKSATEEPNRNTKKLVYIFYEILQLGNKLTTKMKENGVDIIYKALKLG